MSGPSRCEVIASESAIGQLVHALERTLKASDFGHLKVGASRGPAVSQYVRGEDVVAMCTRPVPRGLRLVVKSETMDVVPVLREAMARATADLFYELLSTQAGWASSLSAERIRIELQRLMAGSE